MERDFKSLSNRKKIDLIPYIKSYLCEYPAADIYIGCDSQNSGTKTTYATVIVLHTPSRGGHVLYSSEEIARNKIKKQNSNTEVEYTRLWTEVEKSLEIAEFLKDNGIKKPAFIDIDLNPDPKFKSNQALRAALGYVESLGYVPRCKPDAISATYVADKICK